METKRIPYHESWITENRKPRNGHESKLRTSGKPTPEYTKEHVIKPCRSCGRSDHDIHLVRGRLVRICPHCKKKGDKKRYTRTRDKRLISSRIVAERWRKLRIPKAKDGPTLITTKWFHLHQSEVHARVYNGEVFLLEASQVPICYLVPIEKYK